MPTYEHLRILQTAEDVTPEILRDVEEAVDWFDDEATMPTDEFLDRLCPGSDYDIESLDNGAVRKIMRHARAIRKDRRF